MRRFSVLIAWMLVFCIGTVVAGEEQKTKPKPKPKPKGEEEVLTFTTKDLERMYGKSVKPQPKPEGKAGTAGGKNADSPDEDPLARLQAQQQAAKEKVARQAEAQQRVAAAESKVAALEKRLASLRNPLLGRPQPDAEQKEAWKGQDQVGRLRMTEESLATARKEVEQARTALEEIR